MAPTPAPSGTGRTGTSLSDKWLNLSKNEKNYTLRWMQKRMGYKDEELLGLNEAALMRAHEYIQKLPSNDRVHGTHKLSDGTVVQNRTDLDDHHADAGDLTSFRKTTHPREKFYYYITTGDRPKKQNTGFFSAIADGATLGFQMLAKVGLDPVGLTVDVAEGIAEHGVGFKALKQAEKNLQDYDVKAIATDLAINAATAGAAAVVGKMVKAAAAPALKAAKKVAPQTVEAIEDVGKKLGMKTAKTTTTKSPQDLARQAEKEIEIANSFKQKQLYESTVAREEIEERFKKELKALESESLNDPAYQRAIKEYDEAIVKLQNDKQFIRESAERQTDDIERKYTFEKGVKLDKGDVSEKHREAFEFTRMGYETPAQREASLIAEQETGILSGWKYEKNLSTEERAIYVNEKTKKIHINNRGTQTNADWEADKKYLLGMKDKRYQRLIFDYETTHTRYPGYVIEGSGQSLGGAEAQAIIDKYGTQEWMGEHTAINPLTSPMLRTRFTYNALLLGDEGEKLAAKLTTIQHSKDLPANIGGIPYGQRIVYDTDVETGDSLLDLLGNAHKLDTLDNRGTIKSVSYINPNKVRKELTAETIEGLKYSSIKPANAFEFNVGDAGGAIAADGVGAADGGTCDVVPVAAAPTYFIGSSPFQTHHERQLMVEEEASVRVNAAIKYETVARGSLVSTTGLNGDPMVCKFSSPAECQTATHKDTGTCAPVPTVAEVVDGVVPPIDGAEVGSGGEMAVGVPHMKTGHANGPQSVIEKLKTINTSVVGYVIYPTNQKTKFEYNFIAY